jgi:hypothetical protein
MKITRSQKSRDTVPLSVFCIWMYWPELGIDYSPYSIFVIQNWGKMMRKTSFKRILILINSTQSILGCIKIFLSVTSGIAKSFILHTVKKASMFFHYFC